MSSNANDASAKYYDIVSSMVKGEDVIAEELTLIKSLAKPNAKILDIGCGTGRHLIPIFDKGYDVLGIDESKGMLQVLNKKNSQVQTINQNIFSIDLGESKFDLILMMWNSFNEIALTTKQAQELFAILKSWLKPKGKILLNCDNAEKIDPRNFNFKFGLEKEDCFYNYYWQTVNFDSANNISTSLEKISVNNMQGKQLVSTQAEIKQRWWSRLELRTLASECGWKVDFKNIKANEELYCVIHA